MSGKLSLSEEQLRVTKAELKREREEGERKIPCFPERGRYDFRPAPVPAFSTRWFALTAATTVCGQNTLSLTLSHSDPGAGGEAVVIDEVEVWVDPR